MRTVDQCCCGCSLRTGTLIIGYLHTLGGVVLGLICAVALIITKNNVYEFEQRDLYMLYTILVVLCVCGIVVGIIQALVSILLVYGGHEEKAGFMVPWMIYSAIIFGLSVLAIVFAFIQVVMGNISALGQIFGYICQNVILWYFMVVVTSYRKSLQTNRGVVMGLQPAPTKIPGQMLA